ncbi:hypothetical protein PUNSTDRAFT_144969, partial [Punctularia strigosozonata HHB-11173 SS5]|uniref:uncharacterized protein n=1 Tax=Punctularia strigosozonata (strain HHB-11173) TaxID=741275 RepID=UPI0004416C4C
MSLESSAWSTQVAGLNRSPSWLDNSRFSIVSGTDSTRSDRAGPGRVLGNAMSRGGGAITKLLAAAGERLGRGPSAAVARFLTRFLRRSLDTAQFECCFDTQHVVYEDLRGSRRPPQCSRILDYFRRLSCVQCLSHLQDALLGLPEDGGILLESEVDSNSRRLFQGLCERLIDAIRHDGAVENVLAAVYYLAAFAELLGPQCRLQLRSIHKLEACLEYRINSTSLVAADRSPLMQALIELQYRMQGATAIALSHGSVNILDSLALDSRYAVFTHRPALYIRAMELEIAIDSLYDALQLVMEKDETASDDVLETLTQLWFQSRRIPSCLPVLDLEHSAEKIGNEPSAVFSHDFAATDVPYRRLSIAQFSSGDNSIILTLSRFLDSMPLTLMLPR